MFEITDVKIALNEGSKSKLKAFATMTLDDVFVVRDMKVIDGKKGLFVAMPCIQATEKCRNCGTRNAVQSRHCSNCGKSLREFGGQSLMSRKGEYRDIAHPICPECRNYIEDVIVSAYKEKSVAPQMTHSG